MALHGRAKFCRVNNRKIPVADETIDGFIALATINRPNKLNALNVDVMDSLKALRMGGK